MNLLHLDSAFPVLIVLLAPILYFSIIRPYIQRKKEAKRAAEIEARRQDELRDFVNNQIRERKEFEKQLERSRVIHEQEISAAISKNPGSEKYRLASTQSEANCNLLTITDFTTISSERYIAFDLETTGLDYSADAIVEIGAVLVEKGVIVSEFQTLVDPGRPMTDDVTAINHITNEMLVGKPKIHEVLPAFLTFVGDNVLVAHNARFDFRFIAQACMRNRFRVPLAFFDTMQFARYWPESPNKKLSSLASVAGIENDCAHRALSDAKTVAALVSATNSRRFASKKAK